MNCLVLGLRSDFDHEMARNVLIHISVFCSTVYMHEKVIHDEYSDLKGTYYMSFLCVKHIVIFRQTKLCKHVMWRTDLLH